MPLKEIGIIDFGIRTEEYFNAEMGYRVIKEAVLLEKLGFSKIWYAEHYDGIYNNWISADVLVTLVAAYTKTINVGVAGTLIQYYQPLKIAADYVMLSSMFPGRIDLGVAKGNVNKNYADMFTRHQGALSISKNEMINEKIKLLINLVTQEELNYYTNIVIPPLRGAKPQLWNLVGSAEGYLQSLEFGTNCSRSLVHPGTNLNPQIDKLNSYRDSFLKKFGKLPKVNIMLAGTCQKNKKYSKRIIDHIKNKKTYGFNLDMIIHGEKQEITDQMSLYAEKFDVNEIVFLELGMTDAQRKTSFQNIAESFSLKKK